MSTCEHHLGSHGAFYLEHDPSQWTPRRVDTLKLPPRAYARRQLTVDLVLPEEQAQFAPGSYCIPVFKMKKWPPVTHIDLRNHEGKALRLRTRHENAAISTAAFQTAVENILGKPIEDDLRAAIEKLVETNVKERLSEQLDEAFINSLQEATESILGRDMEQATINTLLEGDDEVQGLDRNELERRWRACCVAEHVRKDARKWGAGAAYRWWWFLAIHRYHLSSQALRRLGRVAYELTENSFIWITLEGCPGSEEIVKISFEDLVEPRPLHEGSRLDRARTLSILGWQFGWRPRYLVVNDPVVWHGQYHLQIEPPPGMYVVPESIELIDRNDDQFDPDGRVVECSHAPSGDQVLLHPKTTRDDEKPCLVFEDPAIRFGVRVERRGFLNLALVAGFAITSLIFGIWLWYLLNGHKLLNEGGSDGHSREIVSAVLVVAPALLIALAASEEEHFLRNTELIGVRRVLIGLGAAAATAATAPAFTDSLFGWWLGCFVLALICTALVFFAWKASRPATPEGVAQEKQSWLRRWALGPPRRWLVIEGLGSQDLKQPSWLQGSRYHRRTLQS